MRRRGSFEKSFVEKIYHFVSKMRSKGIAFFLIGENTNSGPADVHFLNQYFLVKCIQPRYRFLFSRIKLFVDMVHFI